MPRNRNIANLQEAHSANVVDQEAQAAYEALLNAPLDAEAEAAVQEAGMVIADLGPVVAEDGTPTEATVAILTGSPVRRGFCACCGTRRIAPAAETAHGVDLCVICYDEAGMENAHSDGHHEAEADANCHVCQGTDPHAGIRAVPVGAGACVRTDDGRLKDMAPSLPENPERVRLVGIRLGEAAPKYDNLQASVIKRDNHVWGGHNSWVMVIVDGMTQRRWFWSEDVRPVRAPRARRTEVAA